jgi:dTDP-4-dehydrorhamnose reductase
MHNEKQPHWNVNYLGVIDLVNNCNILKKKLVHISTDYIYANSKPEALEEDVPVHLGNWYTYTKLLADGYVQAVSKDYLLIRTTFRPRPYPFPKAWLDHLTNADYTDVIAEKIIKLIEKERTGVFNVGTEVKTLLSLARETVPECTPMMDDHKYLRPQDVTMNINKLKNILNE